MHRVKVRHRHTDEAEVSASPYGYEKSKRRDVYTVDVNIPTNLVFGIAIPTSSFNFVQLLFMPVLSKFRYLVQQDLYFMPISDPQALSNTHTVLGMLQPWAFRSLNRVDPLDSVQLV